MANDHPASPRTPEADVPLTDVESDAMESCSWSSETGTEGSSWEYAAALGRQPSRPLRGAAGRADDGDAQFAMGADEGRLASAPSQVVAKGCWSAVKGAAEALGAVQMPAEKEEECARKGSHGRSRSPRGGPARRRGARAEETLIIFDWDDTLLPSTWLQEQGLRLDGEAPTEAQVSELGRAARRSARTLAAAKRLGVVVVVTNAELGWVELSCRRFLPTLTPLLEGVKIRSARWAFERQGISSPLGWKRMAFHEELRVFTERCPSGRRLTNVVSLGDSAHERDALLRATENSADCWGKSVKFLERPGLDVFNRQHRFLMRCLRPIVRHNGKLDLCLRHEECST